MPINLNFLFDLNFFNVSILYRFIFNSKRFRDDNLYENFIFYLDFNTSFDSFILDGLGKIIDIYKIRKVKLGNIYTIYRVRLSLENYPNLKYVDISNCSQLKNLMYLGLPRLFHQNFIYIVCNENLIYLNCENTYVDKIYISKKLKSLNCKNSEIKEFEFICDDPKLKYFIGKLKI